MRQTARDRLRRRWQAETSIKNQAQQGGLHGRSSVWLGHGSKASEIDFGRVRRACHTAGDLFRFSKSIRKDLVKDLWPADCGSGREGRQQKALAVRVNRRYDSPGLML